MGTLKTKTFSSGKAAIANARSLAAKGQISKSELRGVERSVSKSKTSSKKR
jgi:hypothetical protein